MQSTEAQGARAKTSTSRTSSTRSKEDQPQHIAITIDGMDCDIIEATQPLTNASTQTWTSTPDTNQESPTASQTVGTKKRRYYAGQITDIRIKPTNPTLNNRKPNGTTCSEELGRQHGPHTNHTIPKDAQISTKIQMGWSLRHRQATPIVCIVSLLLTQDWPVPWGQNTWPRVSTGYIIQRKEQPDQIMKEGDATNFLMNPQSPTTTLPAHQKYGPRRSRILRWVHQNILNRQITPTNLSTTTTNPADQIIGQLADN